MIGVPMSRIRSRAEQDAHATEEEQRFHTCASHRASKLLSLRFSIRLTHGLFVLTTHVAPTHSASLKSPINKDADEV